MLGASQSQSQSQPEGAAEADADADAPPLPALEVPFVWAHRRDELAPSMCLATLWTASPAPLPSPFAPCPLPRAFFSRPFPSCPLPLALAAGRRAACATSL